MRRTLLVLLLVATAAAHAQSFRYERGVKPGGTGPNRLEADLALLSGAAPDLRDLRLYSADGTEIAYLLDRPSSSPKWIAGDMLDIVPSKRSSGFELDLGSTTSVDALRFEGIAAPFLKHATIEGSGDRVRWTILADTTVFDLPSQKLSRRDVEFAPGVFRYLRVTWDDRSSARVGRPMMRARVHGSAIPPATVRGNLRYRVRASERGRSRYHIDLPTQALPITAIEIRAENGDVFREASVSEPRLVDGSIVPVPLGTATLRQAERNGIVASDMVIPISQPQSRELEVVIDDGGSSPLQITGIVARLSPQPSILFESPDGASITARFGDASLAKPTYDLEAARELLERSNVHRATWSNAPVARDTAAAPAPLKFEGAPIERGRFRFSRHVASAPAGLAVLPLDADVLARSRELADVRLVDRRGNQIPYVIERRSAPVVVLLGIRRHTARDQHASIYQFALPYATMPDEAKLVITTSARVFSRRVTLRAPEDQRRGREGRELASATWESADAAVAAPPLVFDLPRDVESVELAIDEGDNAPLPITSAEVHLPAYALRFYSSGSRLDLLYGDPAAQRPRYDLALLAPRLFAETANEIGFMSPPPIATAPDTTGERKFFWIAIALVAVLLMVLVARLLAPLVREEPRPL